MESIVKRKHNGVISIWKFIFSMMILLHHFYAINDIKTHNTFKSAAIAVDFFFMVSGYLLALKVDSEERKSDERPLHIATRDFILSKIKAVWPYLLITTGIFAVMSLVFRDRSPLEFFQGFVDLTFIQQAGLPDKGFVGGAWYLSAMILAMLIIYPLQKKFKRTFSWVIAPIITIFIGGLLIHGYPSLRDPKVWVGITHLGTLKALFEIALGCTIFEIVKWLKGLKFKLAGKVLLSIIEMVTFGLVIGFNLAISNIRSLDWIYIILIMIGVAIAFSEQTALYNLCCNKFFYYLEKLSTPIFISNFVFIRIFNNTDFLGNLSWTEKCIALVFITIGLAMLELWLIGLLKPAFAKCGKAIKAKIIY